MVKPNRQSSKLTDWRTNLPMKFMLVQLLVAAVIIIASVGFLKSIETDRLIDNQEFLSINLGKTIVAKLQQKTNKIENLAVSIGALGELYQHDPKQLNAAIPALLEQPGQQEVILGGGVWPEPFAFDPSKRKDSYFWARNSASELIKVNDYNTDNISPYYQEAWYVPAKYYPTDTTYWSKSYIDPYTQNAMLTASVPMWLEHRLIGVSTVDIALSSLDNFFNSAVSGHGGYVFALDQQNRLLSYPDTDLDSGEPLNSQTLFQPFSAFTKEHPSFAPLQQTIKKLDTDFIRQADLKKAYEDTQLADVIKNAPEHERAKLMALINQNANNKLKQVELVATQRLTSDPRLKEPVIVTVFLMPGTYWKIVLVTPMSSITYNAQSLASSVGIYLVSIQIFALMLLFIVQNKLFITPISRMVRALNDSNPAKIELMATNRNDEIGMLAKAFSSRTHQLEVALASLDATNLALEQQLDVQQQSKTELQEKKEQLNSVLNSAHNLIFIKNLNGELTLVNDQFCQTLSRKRENILGLKDHLVMPKEIATLNQEKDRLVIKDKIELSYEQSFPVEGKQHIYLVTKFPIFNDKQQLTSVGTIAFDISATKEAELKKRAQFEILRQETSDNIRFIEKLEQTNKRLQNESLQAKLESNRQNSFEKVKHENQTIYPSLVAAIVKPIFRKQDDLAASAYRLASGELSIADFNSKLANQTERLRHLEYLLSAQDYIAKPIDLVSLLEHVVALLQPKLTAKNIELEIKSDSRLIVEGIHWHYLLIFYRAISNTITDAFYQQGSTQKMKVSLNKETQQVVMKIYDNGKGFNEEQLAVLQSTLDCGKVTGTLSALSVWLKSEFQGELSVEELPKDSGFKTLVNYQLSHR
ncbi:PAS domain S-box protein [Shewanella schlegeliana]|uniref:histidine kinase n=1 Tax=Shewanella schlegeliana TaxID=190308 RepID=A0ABS1SVI6_9GAMM|nr:PAS domain S-box protein [Shewanella schlegeliana]MBL4911914.1 PAS domain S-box protein [Shewanella schlegeliana]MCL1110133.1 PAS domain S-box protein [Shewanella schlegeliana]GIU26901.1 sensor histidine kinase [Shewanella schlegeliana]